MISRDKSLSTTWLALILAVLVAGCAAAPLRSSGFRSEDGKPPLGTGVVLSFTDLHFDLFYDLALFPALVRSAPAE